MSDESGWQLVVEYPDQSPSFGHGVEAGKLWQRMVAGTVAEFECYTLPENREVLRRIAAHLGWHIDRTSDGDFWDYSKFTKIASRSATPNPRGFHIVG